MHITIVTAEPRGAYHLAPLAAALAVAPATFTHLIPYPEPVQGTPVTPVTADLGVLRRSDKVVVTGGGLTPWTELVTRHAHQLGVPVLFSELAGVTHTRAARPVSFTGLSAMSDDGACRVAHHHHVPVRTVTVTGNPMLDDLPDWQPERNRVLLLSTSDMQSRDPNLTLRAVGETLLRRGFDVQVRCHPREERRPWNEFNIDDQPLTTSVARAAVVVGYPGTAHTVAVVMGVPTIAVAPTAGLDGVFSDTQRAAVPAHTRTVSDTIQAIHVAQRPDQATVARIAGPVGGAAQRLVSWWCHTAPDTTHQPESQAARQPAGHRVTTDVAVNAAAGTFQR